jgi:rhamnosyl/mannosyltransferase
MNRDNVLIHSNYSPENHGGIEFVVSVLLKIFSVNNNLICYFGGEKNQSSFSKDKIRYVSRRIILKAGGASLLLWGNFSFVANSLRSRLIIFQEPYPTLWPAILFLRCILRKKVVVLIHANPVSKKWIMSVYDWMRSFVFSGSVCVTTSPNLLSRIDKSSFSKSLVIPLCIPDQSFDYAEKLYLASRYALYIGRLAKYKGIEYLLESAKLCPEVNFVIAGDGPLAGYIYSFMRENNIKNINFINRFVTNEEKYELIERSSFVLFPSVSENEAFGLVQLEAMKSRKAIINTWLNSGVNYVAPHQNCALTVKPKKSDELSDAIKMLWNDISLAIKLGQNGFMRFHSLFHEELFIKSWNLLLSECLSKDKPGRF